MALSAGAKIGYGIAAVTGLGLIAYALTRKSAAPKPGPFVIDSEPEGTMPVFSANGTITTSSTCPGGKMPIPLADGRTYCPRGQPPGTIVPAPINCESGKATPDPGKHRYICT